MSVKVMSLVWQTPMQPTRKLVFLKLADCADDDGSSIYPSIGRVARETGVSERTVQRLLREGEATGDLVLEGHAKGGRGHTRLYRMALDRLGPADGAPEDGERVSPCHPSDRPAKAGDKSRETQAKRAENRGKSERVTPCRPSSERVTPATGKGDTGDRKGCQSLSPDSSRPVKDPGAAARARDGGTPAPALQDDPFGRAVLAVCQALDLEYLPSRLLPSMNAIETWLGNGAYPDPDILGAVRACAETERAADPAWQPRSLHAFTDVVTAAVATRRAQPHAEAREDHADA